MNPFWKLVVLFGVFTAFTAFGALYYQASLLYAVALNAIVQQYSSVSDSFSKWQISVKMSFVKKLPVSTVFSLILYRRILKYRKLILFLHSVQFFYIVFSRLIMEIWHFTLVICVYTLSYSYTNNG